MKRLASSIVPAVFCATLFVQGVLQARAENENKMLTPVAVKKVEITDKFWAPKLTVYGDQTIDHSWKYVDSSIQELINAAKPEKKPVRNGKWMEANLHKVLETAAYQLALDPKPELDRKVDEVVAVIAAGQRPDGFAHAWVINRNIEPWTTLYHQHDGYVCGHMYEAAAAHFRATGKRNFLDVACKSADQAWRHFVEKKNPGFPGHAEIELALVELFRVTGNKNYLDLARAFIERRGAHPEQATRYPPAYFQDDLPVRQQKEINGHAVRAVFFATGVADLALESGDKEIREVAGRLWRSAAKRKMYITGSAGASARHEAFGPDYELPNGGYCESCAACGMANFAHRMLRLEADADAADELERILYNAVLHGIGLDGRTFYYRNPLSDRDHPRGNNWCCCPPTLSRTLLHVGRYAYAHTGRDIYEVAEFSVRLRVPGWCQGAKLKLNGKAVGEVQMSKGYAVLRRRWQQGDTIELDMPMPVLRMEAHPKVKEDVGKVAIQRGPLVYALEGLDNDGNPAITLPADPRFKSEHRGDFLGGVTVIRGVSAAGKPFTAVPFYVLANREKSQQEVWLTQAGKKEDPSGWEGRLYRRYSPGS